MNDDLVKITHHMSAAEVDKRNELLKLLKECPIPGDQLLSNLALFLDSKNLSRILGISSLFQMIVDVQGAVLEFGTRWGQNMALFSALRGIYDPFNRHRKLVCFDTFRGFPSIHEKDGKSEMMKSGNLKLTENYELYLEKILTAIDALSPLNHLKKFDLYVGDATEQIERFLKEQPHTIVALAYFDFDLYEPTKKCLQAIKPRLTKGSVLAFDEVNDPDSPGETLALMEMIGLNNVRLKKFPHVSRMSYLTIE
jgi:hypothetical protein